MEYETDTSWARGLLRPDENLLWTGKPEKVRLLQAEDLYLIPLGLGLACFFAFFFLKQTLQAAGAFRVMGTAVVCALIFAALWMALVRPVTRYLGLKKARYALTNRRVIAQTGKTVKSLELLALPPVTVKERGDGRGDIRFGGGTQTYTASGAMRYSRRTVTYAPELELADIADVNRVEYRIRQAVDQLKQEVHQP